MLASWCERSAIIPVWRILITARKAAQFFTILFIQTILMIALCAQNAQNKYFRSQGTAIDLFVV